MALPLEPESGMFPDTLVEPFIAAPELEELARDVMATFDEFRSIETGLEDGVRIAYVWETKPFDPLKDEFKPHTIAKVTKAGPLWRCLAETDLVIQFRQTFWGPFTEAQRRAVVHHELTHIVVEEDDKGGVKISLREHDVEDFSKTMRRFGPIIPGRAGFVKAYLDWQHEQETPDPTPLRPLGDAMSDALDQVVDRVNAGELDDPKTGTKVTARRGPKA